MDNTFQNIFECLQISEDKLLEKNAQLRTIKEDIDKGEKIISQLILEKDQLEKDIKNCEVGNEKIVAKQVVQKLSIKALEEKVSSFGVEFEEKTTLLEEQENYISQKVEDFIKSVAKFHSSLCFTGKMLLLPIKKFREKTLQMTLEEDAKKCEFRVREDLLKQCSSLELDLQHRQRSLTLIQEETINQKLVIEDNLKEAIRRRNEISEPHKISTINRLEKEICAVQQEIEFLKGALIALEKEKKVPKFNFTSFKSTTRVGVSSQLSNVSTQQKVFTRNA